MTSPLELKWSGSLKISDIRNDEVFKRGVYLWGFTIDNHFIPYYIGISDNIHSRMIVHIENMLRGAYTIFHKDSLKSLKEDNEIFKKYKAEAKKWEIPEKIAESGIVYNPTDLSCRLWFIDNIANLNEHINYMVSTFSYTYALYENDVDDITLKDIEKHLIDGIHKNNLWNTVGGEPKDFKIDNFGLEISIKI